MVGGGFVNGEEFKSLPGGRRGCVDLDNPLLTLSPGWCSLLEEGLTNDTLVGQVWPAVCFFGWHMI